MKAVIYTRVSQDRNNVGRSVTEQEDECRAVCQREGWTVTEVFTDNDRSASRYASKTRPAFEDLRRHIQDRECDVLVTWEASRSTRDLATYVQLRDLCRERGVRWSYSGRTFDLVDDADQFTTGLDALLAEQESARTQKRVTRAMRANAMTGRPHGRASYGYRRVYDSNTRQLLAVEIDNLEAAVLREAADRVLTGEPLARLAADFNARGITTRSGSKWRSSHISRYLLNPSYAGKRVYKGKVVGDAIWPPIFDEATWWRMHAVLTDPARHTARNHHELKHLLSGIATCGRPGCGAVVYIENNRGVPSYMCSAAKHVSRRGTYVDDLVQDVLLTRLARPDRRVLFAAAEESAASHVGWEAAQTKRARLNAFYDSAAAGEITSTALARIEGRLLAEIAKDEADARRAALPAEIRRLGDIDVAAEWAGLPLRTRRAAIRYYLDITILPTGQGRRTFDPASVQIVWKASP